MDGSEDECDRDEGDDDRNNRDYDRDYFSDYGDDGDNCSNDQITKRILIYILSLRNGLIYHVTRVNFVSYHIYLFVNEIS